MQNWSFTKSKSEFLFSFSPRKQFFIVCYRFSMFFCTKQEEAKEYKKVEKPQIVSFNNWTLLMSLMHLWRLLIYELFPFLFSSFLLHSCFAPSPSPETDLLLSVWGLHSQVKNIAIPSLLDKNDLLSSSFPLPTLTPRFFLFLFSWTSSIMLLCLNYSLTCRWHWDVPAFSIFSPSLPHPLPLKQT